MAVLLRLFPMLFCCITAVHGQEIRASITGSVSDPSSGAVPLAQVQCTHLATATTTVTQTNAVGRYACLFLSPGPHTVTVKADGFRQFVREDIVLETSQRLRVDIQLEVGELHEKVTVNGQSSFLETESASRGNLVTHRQVLDLPNNGRNIYQLAWAAPGVVKASTYWGSMENYAVGNASSAIINGGVESENETVMDGVTNTQPNRDVIYQPPLESVEQMKVHTSKYDAAYGRLGGGVIAITTKSGANAFHGSAYEFNKTASLAANAWISNFLGEEEPHFINNTFGFQASGPVLLPKVVDGRDHLFFMVAHEGLRQRSSDSESALVPTAERRHGDFSTHPQRIYDPLTTREQDGGYIRTPFVDNRIPASRLDAVARNVLEFVPLPNLPGRNFPLDNYANFGPAKNGYNQILTKFDYRINDANSVYFSYGTLPYREFDGVLFGDSPAEPSNKNPLRRDFYRWAVDWTSMLDPSTVLNLRVGLGRYVETRSNPYSVGFDPRQLGFADELVSQFGFLHFPQFNISGYTTLGATQVFSRNARDSWSYQLNLNRIQERHQLKAGAEFRIYNENLRQPGSASGTYSFTTGFTQANPARSDAASGDALASFLLGYPSSGGVNANIDPAYQSRYYALFVQDDWKITPRLTLNLGLRWDYESPYRERHNRMVRGFAFGLPSPIAEQVPVLNLTGGLLFAGSSGEQRLAFDPDSNNFQPRAGFAYRLNDGWVLRGGYGLYYMGAHGGQPNTGFSQNTSLTASLDGGNTPNTTLANPLPDGLIPPIGSSAGMSTQLGRAASFGYLDRAIPYAHQYSFGVQHLLAGQWELEAAYSGTETRRYPVSTQLNVLPEPELGKPDAYYRERISNPMAGLLPLNAAKNGNTIPRQDLLLPFPQYTNVNMSNIPLGRNSYHSLQMRLTRRYAAGLTLNAAYTISKNLEQMTFQNPQDFHLHDIDSSRLEKRLVEFDVPQKFAVLTSYELPFGRGKRWGSPVRGFAGHLISGWQINSHLTIQSGFPVDFPNAANIEARSAKLPSSKIDLYHAFDTTLFPTTSPNLQYELRTFPSRFPDVRLYPLQNLDISLAKSTRLGERLRLEIRAEFLNAFNHPWFSSIHGRGTDVTRDEFGWYELEEQNQNRQIALVAKFHW